MEPTQAGQPAWAPSASASLAESSKQISKEDEWVETLDLRAFRKDLKELGTALERQQGQEDVDHLNKMILWSNLCGVVGLCSMGFFGWNLITMVALSTWTTTRWTMIAHHICHPQKGRWNRFKFALGSMNRRICDWFDWMLPEAWNVEHNNRHHYCLSEIHDPDLVEQNTEAIRTWNVYPFLKYALVLLNMFTWKWQYYAPNTYKELKLSQYRREGKKIPIGSERPVVLLNLILENGTSTFTLWEFIRVVIGPYLLIHFFVLPIPFYFLGEYVYDGDGYQMYKNCLTNLVGAELLANVHAFVVIVTNHAGDDLYRFTTSCKPYSGSFFLRQVIASVNFRTGSDINDFFHGYLNYQIEHHLWPNLSMRSYQKAAPLVKEICKKHNVPYLQQNVFTRVRKTIDIMVGTNSMRKFPIEYEMKFLEIDSEQAK